MERKRAEVVGMGKWQHGGGGRNAEPALGYVPAVPSASTKAVRVMEALLVNSEGQPSLVVLC